MSISPYNSGLLPILLVSLATELKTCGRTGRGCPLRCELWRDVRVWHSPLPGLRLLHTWTPPYPTLYLQPEKSHITGLCFILHYFCMWMDISKLHFCYLIMARCCPIWVWGMYEQRKKPATSCSCATRSDFSVNCLKCPVHFVGPDLSMWSSQWTLYYDKLKFQVRANWCGFVCGVSKRDCGFSTRRQLRVLTQKKANSPFYFLSDSSNLIIKGIRPFLGPVSRAAGIVITTVSDGVQGLTALASLGHLALSWLFHRAGPQCQTVAIRGYRSGQA